MHELREVVAVEVRARLSRVGDDRVRIDLDESRPGYDDELGLGFDGLRGLREEDVGGPLFGGLRRGDQGTDTAAEACALRHQDSCSVSVALLRWTISTAASRYATAPAL
ncbi:hypothetical protein GCM10009775_12600 [Microbacterium aoyamense]|uniref:Uncharacterized protein n=1 Tax=Microbacterium aoyamense TaxID=344166 RepID=A0ABN2PH02_9MICO